MPEIAGREGVDGRSPICGGMRPATQVTAGVGVGALVLAAAVFEVALGSALFSSGTGRNEWGWWILFFVLLGACALAAPAALGLLRRGTAGMSGPRPERLRSSVRREPASALAAADRERMPAERRLLEAIERRGEITPVRAALEATLTVAEADRMLSELAEKGHLEVRARDGKLVYSF